LTLRTGLAAKTAVASIRVARAGTRTFFMSSPFGSEQDS
jgi:hypothetical protein